MPQHPPTVSDEALQHWINRVRRSEKFSTPDLTYNYELLKMNSQLADGS